MGQGGLLRPASRVGLWGDEPEVVAVSSSQVLRIRRPGEGILGRLVAFSRGVAFSEEARVDSHERIDGEHG